MLKYSFRGLRASLALVLMTALVTPAFAATIKVPNDFATIQEAIDAAAPGDTISVSSGEYVENLMIPPALDGLEIVGKGMVNIDGQNGSDGIVIQSSSITLKNLRFRHAGGAGIVAASADKSVLTFITIDKVTVINSDSDGMDLTADGVLVKNSTCVGCGNGIDITGAGAEVTKTSVLNDCDNGISITGNAPTVSGCTVDVIEDGPGIDVNGNDAVIEKNKVSSTCDELIELTGSNGLIKSNTLVNGDSTGIDVSGDNNTIEKNNVMGCCDSLIDVSGANAVVNANKVGISGDYGIEVDGTNPTITKNQVVQTGDDSYGIYCNAQDGPATVENNKVTDSIDTGYYLMMTGGTIKKNQATNCGAEEEAGFEIVGDMNTVESNTAKDCEANGFVLRGSSNTLFKNKALHCTINGILIESDPVPPPGGGGPAISLSNVLDGNVCTSNEGQGLNNEGVSTLIRKNRLSKNRQDLTNATSDGASYVDDGGNKFTTGGLEVEPEIDD